MPSYTRQSFTSAASARMPAPAAIEFAPSASAAHEVIKAVATDVSRLGLGAAEVRGVMDDTLKVAHAQADAMSALASQLVEVQASQAAITSAAQQTGATAARAREALQSVGEGITGIVTILRQVADAAEEITRIALQTRLVAFNASIEARRAGDAGRGFGVVADAVKDLAGQVENTSKAIMTTLSALDGRVKAFSVQLGAEAESGDGGSAIHAAFQRVEEQVHDVGEAAAYSLATCGELSSRARVLEVEVREAIKGIGTAMGSSDRFLQIVEQVIEQIAGSGVETDDTLYIRAAQEAAGRIAMLVERALAAGETTEACLFDERYHPIPGTNPPQHTTCFIKLADRLFPQVQEAVLALSDKVVFCIAADRNGYIATHNKKYCHPQRGDLVWDTANSRYRRIFDDRTGLASARNQRPFLLQTYRRDMGGGNFVILKEAAAPIVIAGRHWGGLRLAFKF